jgi:hypothetical protein
MQPCAHSAAAYTLHSPLHTHNNTTAKQDGQERQKELQERSAKRTLLEEFIRESEWGVPELEMVLERHRKHLSTTAGGTVAAGAHVVDFDRWLEVRRASLLLLVLLQSAANCCYIMGFLRRVT